MTNVVRVLLVDVAIALGVAACSSDDAGSDTSSEMSPSGAPGEVVISDFQFSPDTIDVDAGTEVTWTNEDGFDHAIEDDDGAFSGDAFGDGESFSFTYDESGEYPYICSIHNSMTGTVVVE
ncbi:MAG: cupredoxin domain-containing protein [Acidimicrobiia bacterium]